MAFPDLEPGVNREERKLRHERLTNIERRRQRLSKEKDLGGDLKGLAVAGVSELATGVKGAIDVGIDLLTIPDELGLTAMELVRKGRENFPPLHPVIPGHTDQKSRDRSATSQANIDAFAGVRNLDDLSNALRGMIDRGRGRPLEDQLMGAFIAFGATASGKALLRGLGLVTDVASNAFLKQVAQEVAPPKPTGAADNLVTPGKEITDTGDVIPKGTTARTLPDDVLPTTNIQPTSLMDNVIGLPPIQSGLTRLEQIENVIRHMGDQIGIGGIQNNPLANRALDIRNRVSASISNTSSALGLKHSASLRGAFDVGDSGRVLNNNLIGVDPGIPGSPTLSDIAARLPRYWEFLTPAQQKAMLSLRDALQPYRDLMDEVGMLEDIGTRSDIIKFSDIPTGAVETLGMRKIATPIGSAPKAAGLNAADLPGLPIVTSPRIAKEVDIPPDGFYIPRGIAKKAGDSDDAAKGLAKNKFGFTRRGLGGADKAAQYDSAAQGIEDGRTYFDIGKVLNRHTINVANAATDAHIGTYFKEAVDPITKELLGETPKVRMIREFPGLRDEWFSLRNETERLKSLVTGIDNRVRNVLDEFLGSGELDDIDDFAAAIGDINVVKGGFNEGATRVEVMDLIAGIQGRIREIRPEWNSAKKSINDKFNIGQPGIINFPGLEKRAFPDHVADRANKILNGPPAWLRGLEDVVGPFNSMYRAFRATGEVSVIGIQGLLGMASSPASHNSALRLIFASIGDPEILGKKLIAFDKKAETSGRVDSSIWARAKLRMGGGDTEYSFGKGYMEKVGEVPGFKELNRAYGFFGDTLRLEWADELLQQEMRSGDVIGITGKRGGRTLEDIIQSGDLEKIAKIVNNMTGWSEKRAFGSVGELLLFAPRFLASRFNTLGKAIVNGGVEGEHARRSMVKMIGFTTLQIVAVNEALGNETDFRPVVDGKPNPDFMVVRALGQDWKFFGTWDSLVRAIILTAGGNGQEAYRGMSSGIVQNVWNFVSGRTSFDEEVPEFPLQDEFDPSKFALFMLQENILPFASEDAGQSVQNIYSGITDENLMQVTEGVAGFAGAAIGVKSSQLSPSENRDEVRRDIMTERGLTGDFYDLDGDVRRDIDHDQRVQEKTGLLLESRRERNSGYQAYLDERTDLEADFKQAVTALWTTFARSRGGALHDGEKAIFGKDFRNRLSELSRDLSKEKAKLRERRKEDLEFFNELDPSTNEYDIALDKYLKAINDPSLEDPVTGTYNFKERERRMEALRNDPQIGALTLDRIERDLQRDQHPIIANLRRDQAKMSEYFHLTEEWFTTLETNPKTASRYVGLTDLYDKYRNLNPAQKHLDLLTAEYKPLRMAFEVIEGQKAEWLRNQPTGEIDRLLVKWGYRDKATHPDVINEQNEIFLNR